MTLQVATKNFAHTSFEPNWVDQLHSRVVLKLDTTNGVQFVAFPADPSAPSPSRVLADCMLNPPAGFAVVSPSEMVVLYDHTEGADGYGSDVLADAARRARAAVERSYGQPTTSTYHFTTDDTHSMVEITLEKSAPTEVDFRFTAFPRLHEMTPNVIPMDRVLAACLKRKPAGCFVSGPKTMVIVYDRVAGDEANLADAADRARDAVEKLCVNIASRFRVEEHTRFIVKR